MTPPIDIVTRAFGAAPLLIAPQSFDSLMTIADEFSYEDAHMRGRLAIAGSAYPRPGANFDGPCDMPGMSVQGSVATIPIYGFIGSKLDPLVKWFFDATDLQDVSREMAIAEADPSITAIVFAIDSPGGSSRGVPEMGDAIAGCSKNCFAYVDGMAASAAYWIASACCCIGATKASDAGSIGVYSTFYDKSQMYADAGVKVQVFSSGKFKGAGVPGTSLSPAQSAMIQSEVDDLAKQFKSAVCSGRGKQIADEHMQGQTMAAPKAMAAGLIDSIHPSCTAFMSACSLR